MDDEYEQYISWRKSARALWEALRPDRRGIIILAALGIVAAAANGSVPYLTGRFFDALAEMSRGDQTLFVAYTAFGVWVGMQLIANAAEWYNSHFSRRLETDLEMRIQREGLLRMLRLPMSFHKNERIPDMIDIASRAGWMTANALRALIDIIPQLLSVLIGIAIAFFIHSGLAWLLVAGAVVYSLILTRVIRNAGSIFHKAFRAWNRA